MSSTHNSAQNGTHEKTDDVQRIENDIEQTRAQLADTVEALAYKADVPARAKEKAAHTAQVARERAGTSVHVARERAGTSVHVARERAQHAVHTAQRSAQEQPQRTKAIAAAAAGVTAALGSVWYLIRRRRH
jgi:ElaB/YqjD/DUF883 family membrane-anchored ribosome-binding protein